MNIHTPLINKLPDRDDAGRALAVLREWALQADASEIDTLDPMIARLLPGRAVSNYPALARAYPEDFKVDDTYKTTLPDLQNGPTA